MEVTGVNNTLVASRSAHSSGIISSSRDLLISVSVFVCVSAYSSLKKRHFVIKVDTEDDVSN